MKEAKYLAKQASLGIATGLGAKPQAEIHPVRPSIEGFATMTEQPYQEAQPSSASTAPTTTTTSTTTTTTTTPGTTSTASVAVAISTPPPPLATTTVTPSSISSQMPTLAMTPTTEKITIHNVESDSDQEEVEPAPKKEQQQDEEEETKKRQGEEHDERLVLTPQDVENLLKDIVGGDKEHQSKEPTKDFNEQQHQLVVLVLPTQGEAQAPLDTLVREEEENEEVTSQEIGRVMTQITAEEGGTYEGTPQWLIFTFDKKQKVVLPKLTLQQDITEDPNKTKRAKTIHHLSRIGSSEVIADIASLVETEEEGPSKY
ncbi:uncharacterized protein LOC131856854 [Cryptomeria japonica]|uniref:uncharacterized protein LOC131856854 n=1 Tax=Cryptomeria japonica TaxID=3369 RepID=UPI0027DA7BDC|nr:uncharacterized protein LOC131856854 [Cryptomeria japonica]